MELEDIAHATGLASARLNQMLIERVLTDFESNGASVVAWLRVQRPMEYARMVTLALSDARSRSADQQPRSRFNILAWLFAPFPRSKERRPTPAPPGSMRARLRAEQIEKGTDHGARM